MYVHYTPLKEKWNLAIEIFWKQAPFMVIWQSIPGGSIYTCCAIKSCSMNYVSLFFLSLPTWQRMRVGERMREEGVAVWETHFSWDWRPSWRSSPRPTTSSTRTGAECVCLWLKIASFSSLVHSSPVSRRNYAMQWSYHPHNTNIPAQKNFASV